MEMMEFINNFHNESKRLGGDADLDWRLKMDIPSPLQERGKVQEIYKFRLQDCHLVDVSDIWDFAVEHVAPNMFDYDAGLEKGEYDETAKHPVPFEGKVPNDVRLPFDRPTLLFTSKSDIMNHNGSGGWSAYVLFHRKNAPVEGQFVVFAISVDKDFKYKGQDGYTLTETQLGMFAPNGKFVGTWKNRGAKTDVKYSYFFNMITYWAGASLAILNNPRNVSFMPAANRAKRKLAHRGMGVAMDAMHRVAWDVDKPVKAKTPHDETFHKMPYHYRRGYWRKCDKDNPRAERRLQAPKYQDRFLWWMWIEGYWAGHPAFGIKKQYWKPRKKQNVN